MNRDGLAAFRVQLDSAHDRSLCTLIEREIIPRLVAVHARPAGAALLPSADGMMAATITTDEVAALVPLALAVEAGALLDHVDAVLARGVPVDAVMVDLLAPCARLLGEYWEADRCDFVEVTMALWRLQELVHELGARDRTARVAVGGHRALFASMPGDQHDFGTVVIDEVFRRDGWQTERLSAAPTAELLRRAGANWFDLIGLTVSCDCHIGPLPAILVAMRNVSRNPRVCIMVGGRIFGNDPMLATKVGADGTARDARLALAVATKLVRAREGETLVCG